MTKTFVTVTLLVLSVYFAASVIIAQYQAVLSPLFHVLGQ